MYKVRLRFFAQWIILVAYLGVEPTCAKELIHARPVTTASWVRQYCGIESLYVFLRWQGIEDVGLADIESNATVGPVGVSVEQLTSIGATLGLEMTAVANADWDYLQQKRASIVHLRESHFAVYSPIDGETCFLFDPANGLWKLERNEFLNNYDWKGVAIVRKNWQDQWFLRPLARWETTVAAMLGLAAMMFSKWGSNLPESVMRKREATF